MIIAVTAEPSFSSKSRSASTEIIEVSFWPPVSTTTFALTCPSSIDTTVPSNWFLALIFMIVLEVEYGVTVDYREFTVLEAHEEDREQQLFH